MAYSKTIWENAPSLNTPVNATNLNKIENGIYDNSINIGELEDLETTTNSNIVAAINELKSGEICSTSEVKTNKVWINDKPIYRKIFEIDSPVLSEATNVAHEISNVDLLNVRNMFLYRKSDNIVRPINVMYSTSTITSQGDRTYFAYRIPIDIWGWTATPSLYKLYVELEYTKTSD